jgi:uncharacterized OB-fold protein
MSEPTAAAWPPPDRLVPAPVGLNAELAALAATTGVLHLQRCDACGTWRHPPRVLCAACGSDAASFQPTAGTGTLFSWTVTHQLVDPAFADHLPYVVAVVALDEGPRVVGNLFGIDPADLVLDLPVEVVLDRRSDTVALVDFRPRS